MAQYELTASEWYAKLNTNQTDNQVRAAFKQWLAADPENELAYLECEIAVIASGSLEQDPVIAQYKQAIEDKDKLANLAFLKPLILFMQRHWLQHKVINIGALALSFILVFALLTNIAPHSNDKFYATSIGEQKKVMLTDGSEVNLNTDTQLQVEYATDRRYLELHQGEAIFSVEHDPERPFDVVAGNRVIRAIGTRFNIFIDDGDITVSVLEGKVQILDDITNNSKTAGNMLASGYSTTYQLSTHSDTLTISQNKDTARIDAWLKGQIQFHNWQLADAIAEHNRYANKKIRISDKDLQQIEITGVFEIGDTGSFIKALQATFPMEALENQDHIILKSK